MVNLEWYRTFKAIYQYGTLTRAAQELMISQPNMSIQLASLESYIGKPLFVRMPRKMMPTEYGKQLYTQIVESIDNLERVEAEFKRTVLNKAPTIRFGTPSEIFTNYLSQYIGQQPDLNLTVEYGLADGLTEKLISNDLDIAIITRQSKSDDTLTYEPLFTESFMIVCNPAMDTTVFDKLIAENDYTAAEKWLKEQKWYAYGNDLPLVRRFWRENFKKRPILKLHATIPDNDAILNAVSNCDGLAVSSDLIAGKALKSKLVRILWQGHTPATNTLYLAYNKGKVQPQYIDQIRSFITTYIAIK
ncbi:DNA-binding transcriptional LysR family regulator [Dysgonomonas sp. PFB1-18]|uniref:LysR family transcriptional regulator n=1 Tax=unclassified Dysgonomonas TaxID=2630389 RepID=UPI00247631E8|nr:MULTISPECIES: LysR family transcriptional regulator [unclassified Dysgonomonas]MDH6307739.1 DNA-binding transcriptional LysR family regulator [Dysgonomonas sp. PF1-14]MDH6337657.1 DNA-binding transcriptional LysR family regulator [Dysgonomonas sp. PF1-16]MDH6378881.1 DNA-binding transcriptional LysR family regulator [Dysgonomonas sp. PFB1-18]MDH6396516.1 DNA-binding transcriptional LysR family regulator [Dysgonomonas sp. PF1-23]